MKIDYEKTFQKMNELFSSVEGQNALKKQAEIARRASIKTHEDMAVTQETLNKVIGI